MVRFIKQCMIHDTLKNQKNHFQKFKILEDIKSKMTLKNYDCNFVNKLYTRFLIVLINIEGL